MREIVSTQFEPTDARNAFPCFDEPSFKAIWVITVQTESRNTILSNTKADTTTPLPDDQVSFVNCLILSEY